MRIRHLDEIEIVLIYGVRHAWQCRGEHYANTANTGQLEKRPSVDFIDHSNLLILS